MLKILEVYEPGSTGDVLREFNLERYYAGICSFDYAKFKKMNNFKELINADKPLLVDFFAEWCGPCKVQAPILKQAKDKLGDQVRIIKIDVDKNPEVAQQFQVQGVPTLILFIKGQVKWRQSGVVPANTLVQLIQQHN